MERHKRILTSMHSDMGVGRRAVSSKKREQIRLDVEMRRYLNAVMDTIDVAFGPVLLRNNAHQHHAARRPPGLWCAIAR